LYYSLHPKLDCLKAECLLHRPFITEVWLSEDISHHKLPIPGYGIVATLCLTGLDMGRGVRMYISSLTILLLLVYNLECIVVSWCSSYT